MSLLTLLQCTRVHDTHNNNTACRTEPIIHKVEHSSTRFRTYTCMYMYRYMYTLINLLPANELVESRRAMRNIIPFSIHAQRIVASSIKHNNTAVYTNTDSATVRIGSARLEYTPVYASYTIHSTTHINHNTYYYQIYDV